MNLADVIETLRSLNEPASPPARLPTAAEIDSAQQRLGVRFHADYRYFLAHASDVTYGGLEPARVTPDADHLDLVDMATAAWDAGIPGTLLPFCEDGGDYYCLRSDGSVVYWSHDSEEESWPDLADWITEVWIGEDENEEDEEEEDEE